MSKVEQAYVDTPTALEGLVHRLRKEKRVAVDTESDGFYVYKEKVCLVQFSVPGADVIVDPLAVDLTPLAAIVEDPHIEKVFHAAEYDVLSLKRDYGFRIENIFDTMAAARMLGYKQVGLAGMLDALFGLKLDKKLQRADWGRRPLSREQLEYARKDTAHLLDLRDKLAAQLEEKGFMDDAQEEFDRLAELTPQVKSFDRDGFWDLKGARLLDGTNARVLQELWLFREEKAEAMNRAPFRVMPEQLLVKLAYQAPTGRANLREVLTPYLLHRFGDEILDAVRRGLAAAPLEPPAPRTSERWDRKTMARYERLRKWRVDKAQERGVDSDIVLPNEALKRLAKANPVDADELSTLLTPIQRQRYGDELLGLLEKLRSKKA